MLVHGWAMHSGIWRDFALQLAQNYRVTCIDMPGHGRSGNIDAFTLEQVGDALVNAAPDDSCCWLGWSLGATVALDIARRYPERVNSLVLLAGNPSFTKTAQWPGMKVDLLDTFAGQLHADCQATLLRFLSLQVMQLPDYKPLLRVLKSAVASVPLAGTPLSQFVELLHTPPVPLTQTPLAARDNVKLLNSKAKRTMNRMPTIPSTAARRRFRLSIL